MELEHKKILLQMARKNRVGRQLAREKELKYMELPLQDRSDIGRRNIRQIEVLEAALDIVGETNKKITIDFLHTKENLNLTKEKLTAAETKLGEAGNVKLQTEYENYCHVLDDKYKKYEMNKNRDLFEKNYINYFASALELTFSSSLNKYVTNGNEEDSENHGKLNKT